MGSLLKQWNHGYLGIILLLLCIWLKGFWFWLCFIFGSILFIDELIQIFIFKNQYRGFIHWFYVNTLYKIKWIRDFNHWLDGVFGK